jgi:hypothetical protein
MTLTRRTWTHPRNLPKTVPQVFGLVACIEIAGRLLVILEGPRDEDDLSHKLELQVDGPSGPLDGYLIDGQADRNGRVLIGEYGPAEGLDTVVPIVLRIDGTEVLSVRAHLSLS